MADTYEVKLDDPKPSGDAVTVNSPSLVKGLIKNPDATVELLCNSVAPVTLAEIDIDESGRVVFNNKDFKDKLLAFAPGSSAGNNCNC